MPNILRKIDLAEMSIVAQMFQFYLHDMSKFAQWPVSPQGDFDYPPDLLPPYWERADHHPYFIMHGAEIAGFCLVRPAPDHANIWDMGQFFILRKFRGQGIAQRASATALSLHAGDWQVRVLPENKPAYRFWKTQIAKVSGGEFTETSQLYNDAPMIFFTFKA